MTIRDLLTHRSGMGLGEGDLLFWPHTTYTRDEIIYRLRFMKPASSFRSHYAYDNLLYMTAGQIIPAVTGKSWDDYVREQIFAPLGMASTNVSADAFKPGDDYAFPHSKVDGKLQVVPFQNLDNVGPAGSINSSAAEMAKWITLQLNRGKFPSSDNRLFSERQSHELWSPQTILPIGERSGPLAPLRATFADYGLGWALRDYHGRKLIGHTGGVLGFVSRVMLVPEENLGVVILTNAEEGGAFDSILYHVLDHYFALQPSDWIAAFKASDEADEKEAAEIMQKQNAGRAADSKPSLALDKYAGGLHRSVVRTDHHSNGKRQTSFCHGSHAQRRRRHPALAIRHIQSSLARPHHRRRLCHVRAQTRRQHRPLHDGSRLPASRLQF